MHIATQKDRATVVELDSRLSEGHRDTLDSLEDLCSGLAREGERCILLDMNRVRTAPSVLLATLVSLQNRIRAIGGELAVIHPSKHVRKVFRVTVMDQVIGLYDDEQAALEAVTRHIDEMRHAVEQDLASPRKLRRIEAASKLARIGDEQGFVMLSEFLTDEDPVMRLQSILSLGRLGGSQVVEPLIRALSDEDYRVRMHAAEALGKTADTRSVEPLKAAVRFERNRNVIFKANQSLDQLLRHQQPFATA